MTGALRSSLRSTVRRGIASVLLGLGVTRPRRCARDRLTVVTFHRVLPGHLLEEYPLPHLAVTTSEFEWLTGFFSRFYTCGTLADLHVRWTSGERPERPFLALTFDDGQRDNFEHARPILDHAGIRATFFVPVEAVDRDELLWHDRLGYAALRVLRSNRSRAAEILGGEGAPSLDDRALVHAAVQRAKRLPPDDRLAEVARVEEAAGGPSRPAWDGIMDWDQVRRLAQSGHEIGSHSMSHPILPLLDDVALGREVAVSLQRIASGVGKPCESFCYPNGSLDRRVVDAVRAGGYVRAVTTSPGPNAPGQDPYLLTRSELQGRHSGSDSLACYQLSPLPARRRA